MISATYGSISSITRGSWLDHGVAGVMLNAHVDEGKAERDEAIRRGKDDL